MLEEMPVPMLREWMAYYQIEPWGGAPDWARHGDLMSLIFNINRTEDTKAASRSDFVPQD